MITALHKRVDLGGTGALPWLPAQRLLAHVRALLRLPVQKLPVRVEARLSLAPGLLALVTLKQGLPTSS